jgi:hypothetical protein
VTPEERRLLLALDRQLQREAFSPELLCFPEQLRPLTSAAKRKVLRCGRRAGKTTAVAFKLLLSALADPAIPVLYVTLTRENAREILWDDLLRLNSEYSLGGRPVLGHLELTMPNGVPIQLRGAHTEREIAKVRGKKFKLAIVDEAQSFPDRVLSPLIKDVIGPTLLDYQGELWLVGTPPPLRRGYFFECYAGRLASGREQHQWTVRENIKLPARLAGADIDAILADIRREFGWGPDDPTYLREYLGQDIEDREALLYQYSSEVNHYDELPAGNWTYLFGIDIGFDDSDAIAVWGWRENERRLYLVEEFVRAGQDVTDLAKAIKPLIERYHPISIVMDEHKKTTAELRRRHGIPIVPAEKQGKPGYIRMFNADLRKAVVAARRESRFAEDCGLVRKDPDALVRGVLQELPASKGGYHSDICDAALYGWRAANHFREESAPSPPPPEPETLEAERLERIQRQTTSGEWWESDIASMGVRWPGD